MTVVGYGKDRLGTIDPDILILLDPAERSERRNYYTKIVTLDQEKIVGNSIPQRVLSLTGDVVIKPSANSGLIQGAYRLEL